MACERFYSEKIVRPGITIIERLVISARQKAQEKTYQSLKNILTPEVKKFLDDLLNPDEKYGKTLAEKKAKAIEMAA